MTGNPAKAEEARAALKPLGIEVEARRVPHPEVQADSLEEVARERALWLHARLQEPFFVEDAGLFVEALRGFPGVYSAYAFRTLGCNGLLRLLAGNAGRGARFEAVIAYIEPRLTSPFLFKGVCPGRVAGEARGAGGFGFDPVFVPEGRERTFAEMGAEEKGGLSHRGRALARFAAWLRENRPALPRSISCAGSRP